MPDVDVSVISPVYGCVRTLPLLVQRIEEVFEPLGLSYEILLIDDGSPDNSWEVIRRLAATHPQIKGIRLSRNFGQHYAITAGVDWAQGKNIIIMDCDLQDDPAMIPTLLQIRQQGYEIVFTRRRHRYHSPIKRAISRLYNWMFRILSDQRYDIEYGSLVLFSEKVAREFRRFREVSRLYIQILKWLGFASAVIDVPHHPRLQGTSSYSFSKLIRLGVYGWIAHSDRLLRLTIIGGITISAFALVMGLVVLIQYFLYEVQVGWTSLILTMLLSTGLILTSIGITGLYIGIIFQQVKHRPLYVIDETINVDSLNPSSHASEMAEPGTHS